MAYIGQDGKRRINALLKPVLKEWGAKASLSIPHHTSLNCKIRGGKFDPVRDYHGPIHPEDTSINVNPYHYENHFSGETRDFLREVMGALMDGNHDNSDIYTDYFDVGWYVNIRFHDVHDDGRYQQDLAGRLVDALSTPLAV